MNTHQSCLDQFDQFCNSVLNKQISKVPSRRNIGDLIKSLEGLTNKVQQMEKDMITEANKILHTTSDNVNIDQEKLKGELVGIAQSYMLQSGKTI